MQTFDAQSPQYTKSHSISVMAKTKSDWVQKEGDSCFLVHVAYCVAYSRVTHYATVLRNCNVFVQLSLFYVLCKIFHLS